MCERGGSSLMSPIVCPRPRRMALGMKPLYRPEVPSYLRRVKSVG